jgi:hypothetical protein
MDQYPTLNLIVRHGESIAAAAGLLPLLGAIAAFVLGVHWIIVPAGAGAGAFLYLLMRSYVELVRVMADMLIPK